MDARGWNVRELTFVDWGETVARNAGEGARTSQSAARPAHALSSSGWDSTYTLPFVTWDVKEFAHAQKGSSPACCAPSSPAEAAGNSSTQASLQQQLPTRPSSETRAGASPYVQLELSDEGEHKPRARSRSRRPSSSASAPTKSPNWHALFRSPRSAPNADRAVREALRIAANDDVNGHAPLCISPSVAELVLCEGCGAQITEEGGGIAHGEGVYVQLFTHDSASSSSFISNPYGVYLGKAACIKQRLFPAPRSLTDVQNSSSLDLSREAAKLHLAHVPEPIRTSVTREPVAGARVVSVTISGSVQWAAEGRASV